MTKVDNTASAAPADGPGQREHLRGALLSLLDDEQHQALERYEAALIAATRQAALLEHRLASPQPTGLQAEVEALRKQLATVTSPEYLTGALEKIGVVDAEWKARAEAAEERLKLAEQAVERGANMTLAFLRYFSPADLAEDASQQWQQLEHWAIRARSLSAIKGNGND